MIGNHIERPSYISNRECIIFFIVHEDLQNSTFGHKENPNSSSKVDILEVSMSNHNPIKLEINNESSSKKIQKCSSLITYLFIKCNNRRYVAFQLSTIFNNDTIVQPPRRK